MTEAEWLACCDNYAMLNFLDRKASQRKLGLFAVACCRRIWYRLPDPRSRRAIELAELFVEGMATTNELEVAHRDAEAAQLDARRNSQFDAGECAAIAAALVPRWKLNCFPIVTTVRDYAKSAATDLVDENAAQCDLLRDIIGDPFRPTLIAPAWLLWHDGTVRRIAQAIYDERAFERLPILADALEDAGCDNADILAHCRGEGPHVRGCWVVDLLLGKS